MRQVVVFLLTISFFSWPAFASDGKDLYEKSCKVCHGIDGGGNPKIAQMTKVKPESLNLLKQDTKDKKDKELATVISDGVGKMKGLKDKLKASEIALVVGH